MNISSKPLSRVKIIIPFLALFIILFNLTSFGSFAKNKYLSLNSTIQAAFWSRGASIQKNGINTDSDKAAYLSEIARLQRKVNELEELDLAENNLSDFKFLESRIVGRATQSDYLVIQNGFSNGVIEGMPVVTGSRSLVGKVVEVLEDFSYVELITNENSNFDGRVLEKDNSLGVVGMNEKLRLSMVDRSADIEEGDIVVTHSGGGIYPGGIYVGDVREVIKEDAEAFQEAVLNTGFTTKDLNILFIITDF